MWKLSLAALALCASPCAADVRLPKILGSNMVLQRSSVVTIWGWADANEEVTLVGDWMDEPVHGRADADGTWQVSIKTDDSRGAHGLRIVGKNTIDLTGILFGEVWIASGQSNMEMPLV